MLPGFLSILNPGGIKSDTSGSLWSKYAILVRKIIFTSYIHGEENLYEC